MGAAQPDLSGCQVLDILDLAVQVLLQAHNLLNGPNIDFPGRSQLQRTPAAVKQRHANGFFHFLYGYA